MKKRGLTIILLLTVVIALSFTLSACGTINKYTVIFDSTGGSAVSSQTVNEGNRVTKPADPTKAGYTFSGWYYNAELSGDAAVFPFTPAQSITLYAKWTEIAPEPEPEPTVQYTVTFDSNGGGAVNSQTVSRGGSVSQPAIPVLADWNFGGWYDNGELSGGRVSFPYVPAADITLYAKWIQFTPASSFEYSVSGGNVTITGFIGTETDVYIPGTIEGQPVTGIADGAFLGKSGLTSVAVPDSVKNIGGSAFYNCSALTSATVGSGVSNIGVAAFGNCVSIEFLSLPFVGASLNGTSNTHFGYIFGAGGYSDNSSFVPSGLKSVIITGGATIGFGAFYGIGGLTNMTLPFVGGNISQTENTHFGYIFGSGGYTDNPAFVPASLRAVIITGGVSIGNHAFYNCSGLTSITIPDGVRSIGKYAFYKCSGLTSITIPDSVTEIGRDAFYDCVRLTNAGVGSGVSNIGDGAFNNCLLLKSIEVSTGNSYYSSEGGILYNNDRTVLIYYPAGKTSASFTVPDGVKSIGSYALSYCGRLSSITLPDSVSSIGNHAFYNCTGLTNLTTGNGITDIGDYAFYNCSGLGDIVIPDSVSGIGGYAFNDTGIWKNAANNTTVYIDNWAVGVKGSVSGNITVADGTKGISNRTYESFTRLKSVALPDSVRYIGDRAFYGCTSLTGITVPDSVTSIGGSAFYNCAALESVTIGGSVTSIGNSAFYLCSNLASVMIPDSVKDIGEEAFSGCGSLAVYFEAADDTGIAFGRDWNTGLRPVYYGVSDGTFIIIDGVHYYLSGGEVTVTGCDATITSADIKDTVEINGNGYSVTSIGGWAFNSCNRLISVTIPGSVTSIGDWAFYNCGSLTDMKIPAGVTDIGNYAFAACSGIINVDISESVATIGEGAFYNCAGLRNVTVPGSVTSIGLAAFRYCRILENIALPFVGASGGGSDTHFGYIFGADSYSSNSSYVPDSLSAVVITGGASIDSYAFYGCAGLTSVTIPDSVKSIGRDAFSGTGIWDAAADNSVVLADNWIVGVKGAVSGNIVLADDTRGISSGAFSGQSGLASVTVGSGTANISAEAFDGSVNLSVYFEAADDTGITFGSGWNPGSRPVYYNVNGDTFTIIDGVHYYLSGGKVTVTGCDTGVTSADIKDKVEFNGAEYSVTSIGDNAFSGRSGLLGVTIPNGVTNIGNYAFSGCTGLTSIIIPDSVTGIGNHAFSNCAGLANATIGSSVSSIGSYAFLGCRSLASIRIYAVNPPEIFINTFSGCSLLKTIHVPSSSIAARYRSANFWINFTFAVL